MDDATVTALALALRETPDNAALVAVLLRAHLARGEAAEAYALIAGREPSFFVAEADRAAAARACRLAGELHLALAFTEGSTGADALLERARACDAAGHLAEGLDAYRRAVVENPTLEDPGLATRLGAKASNVRALGERPRLRVIANDDTTHTELPRLLHPDRGAIKFEDVGGLAAIKEQIRRRILTPFQKPSLFQRFRKRIGGGILLYGPPGCGKTLLARATAGECGAKFYNVAIPDVLDMYIGESERKLHAIFEQARRTAPAVLFFDEIEALAGKREHTREATSSKLVSVLLSELDGFARNNAGVLVLGATNVPWALDPAARRPGRFDRVLFVPPPDKEARTAILQLLLAGRPTAPDVNAEALAARTAGFSGADLENVVETAADAAIEASIDTGREVPITAADLAAALRVVKATTLEWLTTARNYARYANEAGQYDDVLEFLKQHGRA